MDRIRIDRASQLYFAVFFAVIFISMAVTYYRYMVLEDYPVFLDEETQQALDAGTLTLPSE